MVFLDQYQSDLDIVREDTLYNLSHVDICFVVLLHRSFAFPIPSEFTIPAIGLERLASAGQWSPALTINSGRYWTEWNTKRYRVVSK